MSPYVRTVKTASGATAVQIVHSSHRGSRDIEHIGSAHDQVQLEVLKAAARQRLTAGQDELDLGLEPTEPAKRGAGGGPLPITLSRMGHRRIGQPPQQHQARVRHVPWPPAVTSRLLDHPVTFTPKVLLDLGSIRTLTPLPSQVRSTFLCRHAAQPRARVNCQG